MEQEIIQTEEGVSLLGIVKLLLSKIKYLILAVLIGCVLGGAFAVWRTHDVKYYGTKMEFYVNPKKAKDLTEKDGANSVYGAYGSHIMDNLIRMLEADSFAETMILNGKQLPEKDVWVDTENETEVALDLNGKIDAAQPLVDDWLAKQKALLDLHDQKEALELSEEKKEVALNEAWEELYRAHVTDNNELATYPTFNLGFYLQNVRGQYSTAKYTAVDVAYDEWFAETEKIKATEKSIALQEPVVEAAMEAADDVLETALEAWRKTAKYKSTLSGYKSALSYSYLENGAGDASQYARSFIYVTISVLNDEEFAEELWARVKNLVPTYVEATMPPPNNSYTGTNCQRISRMDEIRLTNPGYTTSSAIKYAVLAGMVAALIACVVVIVLDQADKRLRDPEIIDKMFNVPLLGVVPSIKELEDEQHAKEKAFKKHKEVK